MKKKKLRVEGVPRETRAFREISGPPDFGFRVTKVSGRRFRVSGFGSRVSGLGSRVSGFVFVFLWDQDVTEL